MRRLDKEHFQDKDTKLIYVASRPETDEAEKVEGILNKYGYDYFVDILLDSGYNPLVPTHIYVPYFYILSEQYESARQTLKKENINNIIEYEI